VDDPVQCPNCGNSRLEVLSEDDISTGDGTPVVATSYYCVECRWHFIRNVASGPSRMPICHNMAQASQE
jgi:DNA-directed RNA polymerase subunit RPC12/RpoP